MMTERLPRRNEQKPQNPPLKNRGNVALVRSGPVKVQHHPHGWWCAGHGFVTTAIATQDEQTSDDTKVETELCGCDASVRPLAV